MSSTLSLWDRFLIGITPKSAEEAAVDAIYQPEPTATNQLSTWDKIKIAVVPVSYGESLVNQIYGPGANPATPPPEYDPADLSSPNVYIAARDASARILGSVGATITGSFTKVVIILGAFILVMVFVYGFAGRK